MPCASFSQGTTMSEGFKDYTSASKLQWFLAKIFGEKDSIIDPESMLEIDFITYKNKMFITKITEIDE